MSKKTLVYYYDVALALPAIWKNNIYTYCSDQKLIEGQIVYAPFGKSEKSGFILRMTEKPTYATKQISTETSYFLPAETQKFIDWITSYYPGTPGVLVQHFIPAAIKITPRKSDTKASTEDLQNMDNLKLTVEQEKALQELTGKNRTKTSILHGITGSGKTRVYCELIKKNMAQGKNSLLLYPEISLTSQLEETLSDYFGKGAVTVYHSKRTPAQQRKAWMNAHDNKSPSIVIGPRSALFMPHHNLGLIIVDEAHDSAYKQDSGVRYSALVAAGALAKQHDAQIIFASATPPLQETQQVLSKGGKLVCMHSLAKGETLGTKAFTIVDMTKKENHSKTTYLLSKQLIDSIGSSIANKKQSLLFLNKRGTARMLLCENCGWHAECPNCELPLTHHHDSFTLHCNLCGFKKNSHTSCLECKHSLTLKSPGIKAVEQDLLGLFPNARIARFDSDNKKSDSFSENYRDIKSGSADIILGTQLITKGLDLPLLETVGILQADSALMLPDYSSEERAFQQLTQVSGRVGRGHSLGRIVVQTYQKDSYMFDYVTKQDWHGFYEEELAKREKNGYPPYSYAIKIWVTKSSREAASKASSTFAVNLRKNTGLRVLGPAPSFYEKTSSKYSWQVIVMSPKRNKLVEITRELPKDFYFDLDPISLL
jgi:primosomal protein N' (replication factor Y)